MAHKSPREATLLPVLEEKQRDIKRYEKLEYRRIFEVDPTKRVCDLWGVCAVLNTENEEVIIEFYAFRNDASDCLFAGDYYIGTLLTDYPHAHGLQLWGDVPGWVIEAEDLNDICEDILKNFPKQKEGR